MKQNGDALWHASEELKRDREVVMEAVKQNGRALEDASKELKGDREVVMEAVKQGGHYALVWVSQELRQDHEFWRSLKRKGPCGL